MATSTSHFELRALAKSNQTLIYSLLFQCAISTLKDFERNEKGFHAELAMTAVLHTHTRKLDYHPHIHIIVPAGGINKNRKEWQKIKVRLQALVMFWLLRCTTLDPLHQSQNAYFRLGMQQNLTLQGDHQYA
jgi:hypothetical protein